MKSKYLFTNYDLLDYEKASKKAVIYLNNLLGIYCKDKNFTYIMSDRIKSLDSINDKIRKKRLEKGKNFNYKVDLLDIAGLRIIFYDKNTVFPINESLFEGFDFTYDNEDVDLVSKLDKTIHSWSPEQFKYEFEKSKLYDDNFNVSNIYGFVEFLMRECKSVVIVKDYIMYQKASGYQSIHVNLIVRVASITGEIRKVPVEIQFRNYTQHLYNECEHARYKDEYRDMSAFDGVFNEATRYLLTVANDTYTNILDNNEKNGKSYFLIRKF